MMNCFWCRYVPTLTAMAPYFELLLTATPVKLMRPQLWKTFARARAPTSSTSEKISVSMRMVLREVNFASLLPNTLGNNSKQAQEDQAIDLSDLGILKHFNAEMCK